MHLFFLERFISPQEWHKTRQGYARSTAVNAIVGAELGDPKGVPGESPQWCGVEWDEGMISGVNELARDITWPKDA